MKKIKLMLMKSGKTLNDLVISNDLLVKAFASGVFEKAPIVLNENESYKDYRDRKATGLYFSDKVVGFVIHGTVKYSNEEKAVFAEAWVEDDFSEKTMYDNWQIELDDDIDGSKKITSYICEFFNKSFDKRCCECEMGYELNEDFTIPDRCNFDDISGNVRKCIDCPNFIGGIFSESVIE